MREALRLAVFERDAYTCQYCGYRAAAARRWDDAPRWLFGQRWIALLHVDHVVPKSRGGTDDLDNLVTSCPPCNGSKYNRTPSEWGAVA